MMRTLRGLALSALLFALCSAVEAQPQKKIPRIGFLAATSLAGASARIEAFRQRAARAWIYRGQKHRD